MSKEEAQFVKALKRVKIFLKVSDIYFEEEDTNRNVVERFISRKLYCFNFIWLLSHILGEIFWIAEEMSSEDRDFVKLTCLLPCTTLSLLACLKSFFLIKNSNLVIELITTIKLLQSDSAKSGTKPEMEKELNKRMVILTTVITANTLLDMFGLVVFAVGPLLLTWLIHKSTGNLVMHVPFPAKFPFDETDPVLWPFAYVHQLWAGIIAISKMHGTDCFYILACTFLVIQFKTLQYDIQRIIPENVDFAIVGTENEFRARLRNIIIRHLKLIRCVDIIETIYSRSSLCNVSVSSIVICVSAFNITTINDLFYMSVFIAFCFMWSIQVFALCYYSDLLIESSTEVSNAVYNSKWYAANASVMKDLLFVLTRSQKPCKLTAAGFTDLNLKLFNKSMSSAWSYFAILHSVYNKKQ